MCRSSTTYNKGTTGVQSGFFNVWFSSQGLHWLFVGVGLMLCLWFLLGYHSCLKKRKARHALQNTNLQLANHKMGNSIVTAPSEPLISSIIAAMPPSLPIPYGVSQPFLSPTVSPPLAGGSPAYSDPSYRAVTLALNKPFTSP